MSVTSAPSGPHQPSSMPLCRTLFTPLKATGMNIVAHCPDYGCDAVPPPSGAYVRYSSSMIT